MSERDALLSKTKPLADPVRLVSAWLALLVAVLVVYSVMVALVGTDMGRVWPLLATACLTLGFVLLIRPTGKPNAIYLRAFRTDKSTAELRSLIASILGPDFRLSGIRPPRERTSAFTHFALPGLVGLRYTGSKFMELEAGDNWLARLWKTYQSVRLVLIDVRDVTAYVEQEVRMTLLTVGPSRVVFITNDDRSEAEWRRLIAKIIGPAGNPAQLQLLNVGHERLHSRRIHSDLRSVIEQLPAGVAGELESGRQFVLEHGNEETLRQKRPLLVALAAAASSFLVPWVILLALQSLDPDRALVITLLLMLPALLFAALLVAGIFRAGARARLLERAGLPNVIGKTGDRGFCSDEGGEILYDPNGGNKCTLPLR